MAECGGAFVSREHGTTGTATVYRLADGRRVLRIEDLHTSNGPALVVYSRANAARGPNGAFDETYADLGRLKGNLGDQNYEIPRGRRSRASTSPSSSGATASTSSSVRPTC